MRSRITGMCILICAWITLGSGKPALPKDHSGAKQAFYYWFIADGDMYHQWCSTASEINDLEAATGKFINTQPGGGTLVANGYTSFKQPHTSWPAVQLFSH